MYFPKKSRKIRFFQKKIFALKLHNRGFFRTFAKKNKKSLKKVLTFRVSSAIIISVADDGGGHVGA